LLLRCGEAVDPVVVKTLLQCFTGSVSRTDMFGDLPIAIAIKHQCRSAVINAVLMQYPEGAGVLNGEGHSPLFLAFKHNADDRTIMGLLNHAPDLATAVDRKTGLLPIQVATENEHSHFIVHCLLKRDLPIDLSEKVRAQLVPHHYSWNHIVSNTEDLYHQVVTKVMQACTQPQVLALAHVEGPDGKIALASATPVCKHEIRVMLRLFNTLEVVNQRPAYTNPVSDTQIFYALRYDPPPHANGQFTVLHEEKKDSGENDYLEDFDDHSHVSALSRHSIRSTLTSRSQQTIEDRLRHIRKEKGLQVIAKLTSRSDIVERELKVRKDYHLSRHYVPAIISVHHTVQHAAYSEAMAEPGYCITMEGADTTAENLMLDLRKSGKRFPAKALKRIGISLLHMHEHGIIHGDFGTHNIGKFGGRWKLLGVGGSASIGGETDPSRGFYHPPESIVVDNRRVPIGSRNVVASVKSIKAEATYDIWAYGVVVYEAIAGVPLAPYACRGKRAMTITEVSKIGLWDSQSVRKALKHVGDDEVAQDLLKHLLHHNPEQRIPSMRNVLEHPFFTGGNLPSNGGNMMDQATPNNTVSSGASRGSSTRSSKSRTSRDLSSDNGPSGHRHQMDPPDAKHANNAERESIENRENNVPSVSPSTGSNRSGRSFGAFRKRMTARGQRA
jgi:serine/threonine protein kinase